MNKTLYRVLLASALMACTSLVSASEQAGVSPRDMTWMKQQQQAMDAFKQNLQGQTLSLPPEQQALINRMQGDVARQQGESPGGEKNVPSHLLCQPGASPGRSVTDATGRKPLRYSRYAPWTGK